MSGSVAIGKVVRASASRRYLPYLTAWIAPAVVTGFLHFRAIGLIDTPGQEPLTLFQSVVAIFANMLGPWAGHLVALVDFPNAGLRGFNVFTAVGLTVVYASNVFIGAIIEHKVQRRILLGQFLALTIVWYGYGFYLIADGLL
jgi:hypothetical protein